ncbi:hypothetical protein Y032_0011g1281 [Ancylostoma ceylanicum]|uniref:Uncharacterized protein n=1 Tax=Ancylostoma ceylanicum TaxID=53326 RepID=A0A016VDW9_9BILA|nr:hypothetical protein Y032_0011g1281 [Ancylostoma ceylanicum]
MHYGIGAVRLRTGGRDGRPRMCQSETPGDAPFSFTMIHTRVRGFLASRQQNRRGTYSALSCRNSANMESVYLFGKDYI